MCHASFLNILTFLPPVSGVYSVVESRSWRVIQLWVNGNDTWRRPINFRDSTYWWKNQTALIPTGHNPSLLLQVYLSLLRCFIAILVGSCQDYFLKLTRGNSDTLGCELAVPCVSCEKHLNWLSITWDEVLKLKSKNPCRQYYECCKLPFQVSEIVLYCSGFAMSFEFCGSIKLKESIVSGFYKEIQPYDTV